MLNFNTNWAFWRDDAPDAHQPEFNDWAWAAVSVPHTMRLETKRPSSAYDVFAARYRQVATPPADPGPKIAREQIKTVTASSNAAGFEPAKAFDEDITFGTGWSASSPAVPQTLTAELTAAHNLNGVRIHWGKDSSWYTFDLQTSTDGATWNTVFSGLTRAGQYTLPEVCTAKDVRQIRVVVTQVSGGGAQTIAGIAEVILYGTPA